MSVVSCFHPNSSSTFHDCGFAFLLFARNRNKKTCALHVSTKTLAWFNPAENDFVTFLTEIRLLLYAIDYVPKQTLYLTLIFA